MDDATAAALVEEVSLLAPRRIVDIGCGWAELLLRTLEACASATGIGIENNADLASRAMDNASQRGLSKRLVIGPDLSPVEQADVALCIGSEHVFGTLEDAITGLQVFVRPGGQLILGTLLWEQPPTSELAADFAEVGDMAEIVGAVELSGWNLVHMRQATSNDWDHFEFGYMRDWEQLALTAESETERVAAEAAADEYREGYLKRKGILGFVFLTLSLGSTDSDPT